MRKVIATELVSLDGVMEAPEKWSLQYHSDEMAEAQAAGMAEADAMLFGRVTYQEFASYWPYQNSAEQPFTDYLNSTPKYVVSTTLEEPLEWHNSTLIKGNVAEEIAKLKRQPGKDIGIVGCGTLVRSLLREDLLDELVLMVHPIVLGRGKRLFEDGGDRKNLELVGSRTFGAGVLYLTYRPVSRVLEMTDHPKGDGCAWTSDSKWFRFPSRTWTGRSASTANRLASTSTSTPGSVKGYASSS